MAGKYYTRDTTLKILNNHFCLFWKSNGISYIQAINELKDDFRVVDSVVSDKNVNSYIKYEYKPKKVRCQLSNKIVYDIETFNTVKCVPFSNCINRLGTIFR